MPEVIPTILVSGYDELKNKIALVRGIVPVVQIDICDGRLVSSTTWPYASGDLDAHFRRIQNEEEGLPFWEDVDFELDLMVTDAVENFDLYTKLGTRRIIFHLEGVGDLEEFRNFLEGMDPYLREVIEIGVALSVDAATDIVFPLTPYIDFVQVMGVDYEGHQGEKFDPECLKHIRILSEKYPDLPISVDGGVNLTNAQEIVRAGATRLVVGSAIFNADDIIGRIEEFRNL